MVGVRPLSFGNTYAYVAKINTLLKWRTPHIPDPDTLSFMLKIEDIKHVYRGFGGSEGRNVANFNTFCEMMLNVLACVIVSVKMTCGRKYPSKMKNYSILTCFSLDLRYTGN